MHISKENEGHYLCEAKNNIGGGVSKVIYLRVNGKGYLIKQNIYMSSSVATCLYNFFWPIFFKHNNQYYYFINPKYYMIHLFLIAPAYFAQKSKQIQVVKGEQAHMQCSALGDTPMEITWKVGGQHISKDGDQR